MNSLRISLRRAVFPLPSAAFVCRQCLRRQQLASSPPRIAQLARLARARSYATAPTTTPPLSCASSAVSSSGSAAAVTSPPDVSPRYVGYWLLGCAASVFGIVVLGGLTRLTESGLSITEWRPVTGALPPLSTAAWEAEFAKYRATPEYARLNPNMTLPEFRRIYYMEWAHRLWGRAIGVAFVVPAVYLVVRRRVPRAAAARFAGMAALLGFQGFLGWWMVRSGLAAEHFAPGAHPRVAAPRLAAHLAAAFALYGWMLLEGLEVLRAHRLLRASSSSSSSSSSSAGLLSSAPATVRRFRVAAVALAALVFATAMSGAFVAGLDAGLIYNEFPRMGEGLAPPSAELWDARYARRPDGADLWWRNALENPSLVQLEHRLMASTTFVAVVALFVASRRRPAAALPPAARRAATGVLHLALLQVTLGISTLIYMVPVPLAAAHQAGSLALFTAVLVLCHRLRVPRSTLRLIQRRLKDAAPLKP